MARQMFSSTEDYSVEWEIIGEHCHVHCLVENWSKSILKEGYGELVKLKEHVRELGYDQMVSISPNPRFCKLLGATSFGTFKEGYEVMVWETAPI